MAEDGFFSQGSVYTELPNKTGYDTAEDIGDEESSTINNLPRHQLSSTASVTAAVNVEKEILDFNIIQDNNITICSPNKKRKKV